MRESIEVLCMQFFFFHQSSTVNSVRNQLLMERLVADLRIPPMSRRSLVAPPGANRLTSFPLFQSNKASNRSDSPDPWMMNLSLAASRGQSQKVRSALIGGLRAATGSARLTFVSVGLEMPPCSRRCFLAKKKKKAANVAAGLFSLPSRKWTG